MTNQSMNVERILAICNGNIDDIDVPRCLRADIVLGVHELIVKNKELPILRADNPRTQCAYVD